MIAEATRVSAAPPITHTTRREGAPALLRRDGEDLLDC